jgi:hypothetical protein
MSRSLFALVPLALLAACSRAPAPQPIAAAVPMPPPVVATPMPLPPAGASANLPIPARLADGSYATPNHAVSDAASVWHLRAGFNVAALTCVSQDLAPDYNRFLARQRTVLLNAHKALSAQHGGDAPFDAAMTRLYNYFAQPAPQKDFCATVGPMLHEAAALPPGALQAYAPAALARLDRPFTDFYATYDVYRQQLAEWRAGTAVASAAAPQIAFDPAVLAGPAPLPGGAALARR